MRFIHMCIVMIFLYCHDTPKNAQIIFEYLFLAGFARFVIEFIRLNPTYLFGLSGAQFISATMMVIGMIFMWKNRTYSRLD